MLAWRCIISTAPWPGLGEELAADQQVGATGLAPRTVKDLIEEQLFARRRDLFSELSVVFMDTTSLSFSAAASTLPQPMFRDLRTLFGAAAVLIRRMNKLGRNLDINYETFSANARLRARAFAVGLRAETPEERHALRRA